MFTEINIKSNETVIKCRKIGKGSPILMIHGGATDSNFFESSAIMLSTSYEVYIYDRRGYGRDRDNIYEDYLIQSQAEDVREILKFINKPTIVFAHSYGGLIAFDLCKIEKELVKEYIIFEVPVYEGVAVKNSFREREDIKTMMAKEQYHDVIVEFSKGFEKRDSRQKTQSKLELENTYNNMLNFIKNEFFVDRSIIDYDLIKENNFRFCVGELSRFSDIGQGNINLANILNKDIVYFPGQHNCPYDLPYEFSALLCGMLSI